MTEPSAALSTGQSAADSVPTFWQLQLLGWGALFVSMVGARLDHRALLDMVGRQAGYVVLGAVFSLALRRILRALVRLRTHTLVLTATAVTVSWVLALLWSASDSVLREPAVFSRLAALSPTAGLGALLIGTFNNTAILVAWSFLYIGIKRSIALQAERERAIRAEGLLATSRLHALQYQLNPHLLFNTLNAISTLVLEERLADVTTSIARLSDFLRTILRQPMANSVTLADELSLVSQYLDIEQVRFGPQLLVTYDIDEQACRAAIPALLLQPLVENAIHHGAPNPHGQRVIVISARVVQSRLTVAVENSAGTERAVRSAMHSGLGLSNVRGRLSLIHGEDAAVRTSRPAEDSFRVDLELPLMSVARPRVAHPDAPSTAAS